MSVFDVDTVTLYTYREAARRVRRSIRTVWRWRADGMPMTWGVREGQRVRLVREDVLLAHWRGVMRSDQAKRPDVGRGQRGRWRARTSSPAG